ncbi:MAG TPA: DegT/DnrJ/EryC1/StrS aminotransferase family protein [Methylomirabilota bacterium]|nr:DegT/DnrJ/EryC1/StrS aminotransferase family protein [Methylomirabilota bacterium]
MSDAPARPTRETFLVFGRPDIREAEIEEVVATLRSGWLGTGPRTHQFETEFATYVGAEHAIAVSSATAAMHLGLLALGIGPGDEVITSAMTFAATVNVILHVGATPVLVDVDPVSQNIDPALVAHAITARTRAIIPVHMAGWPCDMTALRTLSQQRGIAMIEDAAHATEAVIDGRKIGSISEITAFSFYVTKNLVTGEGGMVTTNDARLAGDIRVRALHGMTRDAWKRYSASGFQHYDIEMPGWKYNMTDIQAALGLHQLRRLDETLHRRDSIWARYVEGLAGIPGLSLPATFDRGTHARHLFTMRVHRETAGIDRDGLIVALKQQNVGTGVHFRPIHVLRYYAENLPYAIGDFPVAEEIGATTISIPLSSALSGDDVEDVIRAVRDSVPSAR